MCDALNLFEFSISLNRQLIPCLFFLVWFLDEVKLVGCEVEEFLAVIQVNFVDRQWLVKEIEEIVVVEVA